MKRLVVRCDGTWQRLASPFPTNIERIAQSVPGLGPDGVPQLIYYHEGIGTGDKLDKLIGGAFGFGIDENIQNAYCWTFPLSPTNWRWMRGWISNWMIN